MREEESRLEREREKKKGRDWRKEARDKRAKAEAAKKERQDKRRGAAAAGDDDDGDDDDAIGREMRPIRALLFTAGLLLSKSLLVPQEHSTGGSLF